MKTVRIITHNGRFHADDVSAVAVLDLVFKSAIEVSRTRDEAVIAAGDIVLDVGGKNDGEKHFDHHQPEGGGVRENGIPYASFGLIWKKFGKELVSDAVAEKFDRVFVQPVDALDNGVQIYDTKFPGVRPFSFDSFVYAANPTWKEDEDTRDQKFMETVKLMRQIIERELLFLTHEEEAKEKVMKNYEEAEDKRIVVLDTNYPYHEVLASLPEPIFAVYKSPQQGSWHVGSVPQSDARFEIRKQLPAAWAGLRDEELQKVSGVADALFCHRKLFMGTAGSKEGAIAMVKKALS